MTGFSARFFLLKRNISFIIDGRQNQTSIIYNNCIDIRHYKQVIGYNFPYLFGQTLIREF